MKFAHSLILAIAFSSALAYAQMSGMSMSASPAASAATSSKMTKGEALKVDITTGKVTLRHGPIENLGMPGMTMMFPVADKKMLAGIKDGDKVLFRAEKRTGTIVVTEIVSAR